MRDLLLGFARRLVTVIARFVEFAVSMFVISICAVFRGLWAQSYFVAVALKSRAPIGAWDSHSDGPMFWGMRIVAIILMVICLILISEGLHWFLAWAFQV